MRFLLVLSVVLAVVAGPAAAAKSKKEMSDHRKDCLFKGDGHYDRNGVSCAPPAKVPKQKKPKPAPKVG